MSSASPLQITEYIRGRGIGGSIAERSLYFSTAGRTHACAPTTPKRQTTAYSHAPRFSPVAIFAVASCCVTRVTQNEDIPGPEPEENPRLAGGGALREAGGVWGMRM